MADRPWANRSTPESRGYDAQHRALRADWSTKVDAGTVDCWRCGERIAPGSRWHLGHADDRATHVGPEHERCSQASGSRLGGSRSWAKREPMRRKPEPHPGLK
jgi:hypothetical protein